MGGAYFRAPIVDVKILKYIGAIHCGYDLNFKNCMWLEEQSPTLFSFNQREVYGTEKSVCIFFLAH
jgi:hypothetical protein